MAMLICFIVLTLLMGVMFSMGKGSFFISGYNTMPKKKRAQYNELALCKFMGWLMYSLAFCMLFWLAEKFYPGFHFFVIGQILFVVVLVTALIYANTGNRFKKDC